MRQTIVQQTIVRQTITRQTSRAIFSLLSIGVILCGSALAADSQLMNLVMPDAKILAGVNATSTRISPLGQFVLAKIAVMIPDQQKLIAATGFNPFQDVSEVLAATTANTTAPGGLIMARGNFPVDKIVAALSSGSGQGPQVSTYGGATLITITNSESKLAHGAAFLGTSIAIAGDLASVKAAIDRSTGANSLDPALAVKVNALSSTEDEWLVSTAPIASLIPANAPIDTANGPVAQVLPLLKSIQSFSGGVKLADNVVITGEAVTSDPKNAQALSAVVKLGMTLLTSVTSSGKNAQLGDLAQLLQTMQLSTDGAALDFSLSIPEAQIENLLNSAHAVKTAAAVNPVRAEIHNGN